MKENWVQWENSKLLKAYLVRLCLIVCHQIVHFIEVFLAAYKLISTWCLL
jgi:hypothetical protein